jgi:hypothetical protein
MYRNEFDIRACSETGFGRLHELTLGVMKIVRLSTYFSQIMKVPVNP